MSLPPLDPKQTVSGIAVDPKTLERVVPSTKRSDGSVRKEIKIRPGFTPQEDVSRFRGSRQQAADQGIRPKGHVVGWAPPSTETKPKPKPKIKPGSGVAAAAAAAAADTASLSKSQRKNAKRAEKRAEKKAEPPQVKENWDDDDEGEGGTGKETQPAATTKPNQASEADVDSVTKEIEQLNV